MIYNWFSTFWISTQCSSLPSLQDLEMRVCMCMYVCVMFVLENPHLLSLLLETTGKSLSLSILHILTLSSFFPLYLKKPVNIFTSFSQLYPHIENPVHTSVWSWPFKFHSTASEHTETSKHHGKPCLLNIFTLSVIHLLWKLTLLVWGEGGNQWIHHYIQEWLCPTSFWDRRGWLWWWWSPSVAGVTARILLP